MFVGVVLAPMGEGNPPPLVSLVAEQAGALVNGTPNLRVHVCVDGRVGSEVPSVTLPASSELVATRAAPIPQSAPSVGVPAAKEAADQSNTNVPASSAASTPIGVDSYRLMLTTPWLRLSLNLAED